MEMGMETDMDTNPNKDLDTERAHGHGHPDSLSPTEFSPIHILVRLRCQYKVQSDMQQNVRLRPLQSDIGEANIRLCLILFITDIGLNTPTCIRLAKVTGGR
jgi:hypothetical protein